MKKINIGEDQVGAEEPTYIIAEAGSNHNGEFEIAKDLITAAAEAGADAVKFQTFKAEKVYVEDSGKAEYLNDDRPLYEILENMEMPYEWIPQLHNYAKKQGITFLSTPADQKSADKLEEYVPAYKIESFMMSCYPFLDYLIDKDKPLIISTGAHTMDEVRKTVSYLSEKDVKDLVLLQCVSAYPTPLEQINVRVLEQFQDEFGVQAGLSDHTLDPRTAPAAAVATGASVIEKHITLDKDMEGPDHEFALEPDELSEMVSAIRKTERALGDGAKRLEDSELELHNKARRYIHATEEIQAGEQLSEQNVQLLAPGERDAGLHPRHYSEVLGEPATSNIMKGEGITWEHIE